MPYNSFILARQAENDINHIVKGKINTDVHHGDYDILLAGKIRLQVKSATLVKNSWKFIFNEWGGRLKQKSDILICAGYDSKRKEILKILCIPPKKIPQWRTSISLPLKRKNKVRHNWDKYLIEPTKLLNQIYRGYQNVPR